EHWPASRRHRRRGSAGWHRCPRPDPRWMIRPPKERQERRWRARPAPSDEIDAEDIAAVRTVERRPAWPLIFGIVDGPARMLARIHAIENTIVNRDVVRIAGAGHELHDLHHFAGLGIIADQLGG